MAYAEHFSIANLPYGIATTPKGPHKEKAVATRLADHVIFLKDLDLDITDNVKHALRQSTLNELSTSTKAELRQLRRSLQKVLVQGAVVLSHGFKLEDVILHLPVSIPTFVDFSCSREHLLNSGEAILGRRSLPPAATQFPIAYTGTAATIVVSGTPIQRPNGMYRVGEAIEFGATRALDYELEVAAIIGKPAKMGASVALKDADDYLFGVVIVNDWSARDIQGLEMTPLGPMNGKSFATSISPWVVTMEALEPFAVSAPPKDVAVGLFLREEKDKPAYDIQLEAEHLKAGVSTKLCTSNVSWMYWTFRDLVAQHTINGCSLQTGDLLATGTVSGNGDDEHGCLLELTKGGKVQYTLTDGSTRTYLEDGDGIRLTAYCGNGVGFGDCTGFVTSARPL